METQTHNWHALAAQRFGNIPITANGRYAAVLYRDGLAKSAYLFPDFDSARSAALGWDGCKVVDLKPCPTAPRCKDFGYSDRSERMKYGD
jgi:hypothetical protein